MRVILYDSKRVKVNEASVEKFPHAIIWNNLTYIRFGIQDTTAFFEEAEVLSL
jgi:hypothetical protein